MPELPEIETIRSGLANFLVGKIIRRVVIKTPKLRWNIPLDLPQILINTQINQVTRRAKYLLVHTDAGILIIHLGMSGFLRLTASDLAFDKHEHFALYFDQQQCLRLKDPRRFGAVLFCPTGDTHPCLAHLGVEPLARQFSGRYLYQQTRGKICSIKAILMNNRIVVGIGNIYANESLFATGISPFIQADNLDQRQLTDLCHHTKVILRKAIKCGGTTLKDFFNLEHKPGYFAQQLKVYQQAGKPCVVCGSIIQSAKQNNRTTFYCPNCQQI